MSIESLFQPLSFSRGPEIKNRLLLAPLTNQQSHDDGTMSDEEIRWLAMRAEGDFGLVMTAGGYITDASKCFPGQFGISRDDHIPGLARLSDELRRKGAVSSLQLLHAGSRARKDLGGEPVSASSDEASGRAPSASRKPKGCVMTMSPRRCAGNAPGSMAWSCMARTATCWVSTCQAT
jgi:2,4-dienoyl-CoA reductase-like NADH-dependent reductase (Old Yellow Enzyme family)